MELPPVTPQEPGRSDRKRATGREMARWRKRRGLTRQQFADLCGRSASWVDKIETGARGLTQLPMLELVASVLHVTVETLVSAGGTCEPSDGRASACLDAFEVTSIREALQRYEAISSVFLPVRPDVLP